MRLSNKPHVGGDKFIKLTISGHYFHFKEYCITNLMKFYCYFL